MALADELDCIVQDFPGELGLAVRHLPSEESYLHGPDVIFPMASVFKVPLLVELYRQVADGRLDLAQPVEISDALKSPGSGVVKELDPGARLSVHDLATLAIIVSDNTATDLLMKLTDGRRTINRTMAELGLHRTSVREDCKGLILMSVGLDPAERTPELLAEAEERPRDYTSPAFQPDPERNNVTTPRDLLKLFTLVERRALLTREACDAILDILGRQQLNGRLPLFLPRETKTAHKTGTLGWTRNDAGIIYLPGGEPVVVCALSQKVPDDPYMEAKADATIARAARAVFDHFSAA